METELLMDEMTAVRRAVDRLLAGDDAPLLDLIAEDVTFEVIGCDELERQRQPGATAVADYFGGLGELVAFWQINYTARGRQIIAWGKESFTVEGCGLEGGCEFALIFELSDGAITRLLVVEDLAGDTLPASLRETAGTSVHSVWGLGQSSLPPGRRGTARV